jgi:hypothetical protein
VNIGVPPRQIREYSTFSVNIALRHSAVDSFSVSAMAYADYFSVIVKTLFLLKTLSLFRNVYSLSNFSLAWFSLLLILTLIVYTHLYVPVMGF